MKSGVGSQNWAVDELSNGFILIANNGGLLVYDGVRWELIPLPNRTILRSIAVVDDLVYAGGQDEIGYFDQSYNFHSLRDQIPESQLPLEDVWQIKQLGDTLAFRSRNKVYMLDLVTEEIQVIDPKSTIISLFEHKNELYYHDLFKGMVSLRDTSQIFKGSSYFKFLQLLEVTEVGERSLFITESDGIFVDDNGIFKPLNESLNANLTVSKIFTTAKLSDQQLLVGTQFNGIFIIDSMGHVTQHIDKSSGLSNNNVHALKIDLSGDLWAGTANGITEIKIKSKVTTMQPDPGASSSFYDIQMHNDLFYFASNNGLFLLKDGEFTKIPNSFGQAWGLDTLNNFLLLAHNRGAFSVESEEVHLFSEVPGSWKFLSTGFKEHIYVGTYEGVDIYKQDNNEFQFVKKLGDFQESSRILVSTQKGELWISHPYRGVFKITHDSEFNNERILKYGVDKGLPSNLLNYVFEINDLVYVTGKKGIFYYDSNQDMFIPDEKMNDAIDTSQNVRRLFENKQGEIWFVAEKEVGFLTLLDDGNYSKKLFPQLVDELVGGFEQLIFHENKVLVCTDNDILVVDRNSEVGKLAPLINFHQVRLSGSYDSLLLDNFAELNYDQNNLNFTYASPDHNEEVLYQYKLIKNGETKETLWDRSTERELTNLGHGNYELIVNAKNLNGFVSDPIRFSFNINPPWYLSFAAQVLYVFLVVGVLLSIILIPRSKYKKDKEVLIAAKNESDQELEKVKTEKLNAELAASTLHLVQKNETISKIKRELDEFKTKVKDGDLKRELKKVISVVQDDTAIDDDWDKFSSHFDQVHTNFLKRLSEEFPQITPKDLKLCAFLRMNLTTKEIAPLLHISVRGVEISRYRLRKKLELSTEVNLNEFMMEY